jgi:Transposase DDE domain
VPRRSTSGARASCQMRHGRKTAARPFTGYKIHAAAGTEAPILTSICVSAANEHDGHHVGALVDQQAKERRPRRVIGDTAYGNVEVREELAARSVEVLAPVHSTSPKDGTIPKQEFEIDLETDTVTCPQGKTARIYKPRPNRKRPNRRSAIGERVAKFSRSDCEPCPLRQRCSPGGQRDIRIRRREDLRQAALRELSDPAERDHSSAPGPESSGCSDSSSRPPPTSPRSALSLSSISGAGTLDRRCHPSRESGPERVPSRAIGTRFSRPVLHAANAR